MNRCPHCHSKNTLYVAQELEGPEIACRSCGARPYLRQQAAWEEAHREQVLALVRERITLLQSAEPHQIALPIGM